MLKTLKAIFSTPSTVTEVAKAVNEGVDKAWWTKQERSEWFLKYLDATQPMNLSRRLIAMTISTVWAISSVVLLILTILAGILESDVVAQTALFVNDYINTVVNTPFMITISFYFASRFEIFNKGK